jgi:pimeloyl-ACP methyl ester carboxylesterase
VVFLHSGVGSAGEWKQVWSLWPDGWRLVAVDAYRGRAHTVMAGASRPCARSLDDFADQVHAVVEDVGEPVRLVGFSWGGATALRVAADAPQLVTSLAVIEPEAYGLLRTEDADAYAEICRLRDRWRDHVRAGRWHEAFEEFIDFYNGTGTFAHWPRARQETFLAEQRARGDLWDVLFDGIELDDLTAIDAPTHVIEGSASSAVDHAICAVVRSHVRSARHTTIPGAGHMMPLTHPEPLTRALLSRIPR